LQAKNMPLEQDRRQGGSYGVLPDYIFHQFRSGDLSLRQWLAASVARRMSGVSDNQMLI